VVSSQWKDASAEGQSGRFSVFIIYLRIADNKIFLALAAAFTIDERHSDATESTTSIPKRNYGILRPCIFL